MYVYAMRIIYYKTANSKWIFCLGSQLKILPAQTVMPVITLRSLRKKNPNKSLNMAV
jgi:hypothetical protein